MRIAIVASHPIQYQAPIFREIAKIFDLQVFFLHDQSAEQQASAGYGISFSWDVDLLAGYSSRFLKNVAQSPSVRRFMGTNAPELENVVRNGKFDAVIVHGWNLRGYWQAVVACRHYGVPVLVRGDSHLMAPRSLWLKVLKRLVYTMMLRAFDGFLYVGARNREYLESFSVPTKRLFFSPHCVDTKHFASDPCLEKHRGFVPGANPIIPKVLFVGRLVRFKRPGDLIEAVAHLRSRSVFVDCIFAGDGPLRAELESLARALGVPAAFLGFVNQSRLPAVYASAHVLVLPSSSAETWGLVVNEALAAGLPCAVSDECGCAVDLIDSGRTGECYPCGNTVALAVAIEKCLNISVGSPHVAEKSAAYSVESAVRGIDIAVRALSRSEKHEARI
jgi:glycosyltransferase involved in cell wall biosynthesis